MNTGWKVLNWVRQRGAFLMLGMAALGVHGVGWASCSLTSGNPTINANFGGISDPNLYAVGENIGPSVNVTFSFSCTAANPGDLSYQIQYALSGPAGQVLPGLMETNVPGIAVEARNASTGAILAASGSNLIISNITLSPTATPNYSAQVSLALQLKRSNATPVVPGYSINMPNFVTVSSQSNSSTNALLSIGLSSNVITIGTCRVSAGNESLYVSLPSISTLDLQKNGVGNLSPSYAIQFRCQNPLQDMYITFTDANDPGNTSDVLSLAPGSTATNVGIQVFLNGSGTPLSFGPDSHALGNLNQQHLGGQLDTTGNGKFLLQAGYKATGSPVGAGLVKAVATYTFAYP